MPLGLHIPRKYLKSPATPSSQKSYTPIERLGRPHHRSKPSTQKEPLVFLADGVTLTQESGLHPFPGQAGFATRPLNGSESRQEPPPSFETSPNNEDEPHAYMFVGPSFNQDGYEPIQPISRHRRRRHNQTIHWLEEVIPHNIQTYLSLLSTTQSLKLDPVSSEHLPCTCAEDSIRTLYISAIHFHVVESISIEVCSCHPAAYQLISLGLFPSAPLFPTLAVDIRVLEFVSRLFLNLAPNTTAWCKTVEEFLEFQGYRLATKNSLRKRFGEALRWYLVLQDHTSCHISDTLSTSRKAVTPYNNGCSSDSIPEVVGGRSREDLQSTPSTSENESSLQSHNNTGHTGNRNSRKRPPPSSEEGRSHAETLNPFPDPLPRARPSDYLRKRCPLCFGGKFPRPNNHTGPDAIICVDACFKQKRNKGTKEPANVHPSTLFVSERSAQQMDAFIQTVRPSSQPSRSAKRAKASHMDTASVEEIEDGYDGPLRVPRSVLATCQESFTAADESRQKASTQFFSETALMALLCRHDRVLWVVSMTSAGEKQHYTLVLIETFFQHVPLWFRAGLMYDVGCQLHQSCVKWGFLSRYLERLVFAVSVFHAFGHQWACQIVYHPRKCDGFGLSDGEGCERFWKSIQHLIPYLRVCGHYQRLYTLDRQILNGEKEGQRRFGEWLLRRTRHAHQKRSEALKLIRESGRDEIFLKEEWRNQVDFQTKPLPRQSKNRGKDAVERAVHLRKSRDILRTQKRQLEDIIANVQSESYQIAEAELQLPDLCTRLDKASQQVRDAESSLGVDGRHRLENLLSNPFIGARMNARALKVRLREKIRARKFELDRLERSFRHQINERKVDDHTESSVQRRDPGIKKLANDYNKLCRLMYNLKAQGKAPRGSVCPEEIDLKGLFALDIDDDIWQDVGLDDSLDGSTSGSTLPLWLCSDKVRSGIKGMLELQRCNEEQDRISWECMSMKSWYAEEWHVLSHAINEADAVELRYQLQLRKKDLLSLLVGWHQSLQRIAGMPFDLEGWGPSSEEFMYAQTLAVTASFAGEARVSIQSDAEDNETLDSEEEEEDTVLDAVLIDTLEAVDLADAFRHEI